jgi:hypothetical protein
MTAAIEEVRTRMNRHLGAANEAGALSEGTQVPNYFRAASHELTRCCILER